MPLIFVSGNGKRTKMTGIKYNYIEKMNHTGKLPNQGDGGYLKARQCIVRIVQKPKPNCLNSGKWIAETEAMVLWLISVRIQGKSGQQ